jgi:hypothetical protein
MLPTLLSRTLNGVFSVDIQPSYVHGVHAGSSSIGNFPTARACNAVVDEEFDPGTWPKPKPRRSRKPSCLRQHGSARREGGNDGNCLPTPLHWALLQAPMMPVPAAHGGAGETDHPQSVQASNHSLVCARGPHPHLSGISR